MQALPRVGRPPTAAGLSREAVLAALGFRPGRTTVSPLALAEVEAGMAEARGLLQPLLLTAEAAVDCAGPEATLRVPAMGLIWRSPALVAVLAGAQRVSLLAGTVGDGIAAAARAAFAAGAYTRAVVLDACGTAAISALAEEARLRAAAAAAARGHRLTIPYSPGYGDWDIADVGPLLRALETRRIGLQASDAHYLTPEKSFCAVAGWLRGLAAPGGAGAQAALQASGCAICFLPGCRYRRTPPVGRPGVLLPPG